MVQNVCKIQSFLPVSAYGVFSPDLLIEYQIFILIFHILLNLKKNIDSNINIDMAILKNIDIDMEKFNPI